LYTPFYQSDILICSPLGLKMAIGLSEEVNPNAGGINGDDNNEGKLA